MLDPIVLQDRTRHGAIGNRGNHTTSRPCAGARILLREQSAMLPTDELLMKLPIYLISRSVDGIVKNKSVPLRELDGMPLVLAALPNPFRIQIEQAAKRANIRLNIVAEVDGLQMQRELVLSGYCNTLMTRLAVGPEVAQMGLYASQITEPDIRVPVVLSATTQRPPTLAVRAMLQLIRKHVQALPDNLG